MTIDIKRAGIISKMISKLSNLIGFKDKIGPGLLLIERIMFTSNTMGSMKNICNARIRHIFPSLSQNVRVLVLATFPNNLLNILVCQIKINGAMRIPLSSKFIREETKISINQKTANPNIASNSATN
ncbi:MAG: hypothetical protein ACXAD7_06570 [Candidatus Kariarchaeaceae archaeon]|jgi:hypothetical protein